MKMLVFERPFQRDLPEPYNPTNNFSKGPNVFFTKSEILLLLWPLFTRSMVTMVVMELK